MFERGFSDLEAGAEVGQDRVAYSQTPRHRLRGRP